MFDRIEDLHVAVRETARGWEYALVEHGSNDGDDEAGSLIVEHGDGFRSREAARKAGEQVLAAYLSELDANTRQYIEQSKR